MSLKNQKTASDFIEWSELVNLIHKLRRDNRPKFQLLVALSSFLGLRISDILSLEWNQILGKDQLIIYEKKTQKQRKLNINRDLQHIIEDCYEMIQPKSNFVFTNRRGKVISIQYLNRELKKIKIEYKLNIRNFSTHSFRKSFGREFWRRHNYSDRALILLSELFSHSSVQITKRYLGIKEEELLEAYQVLTL
jgi:integrase